MDTLVATMEEAEEAAMAYMDSLPQCKVFGPKLSEADMRKLREASAAYESARDARIHVQNAMLTQEED
jgi:hypothetical protein